MHKTNLHYTKMKNKVNIYGYFAYIFIANINYCIIMLSYTLLCNDDRSEPSF